MASPVFPVFLAAVDLEVPPASRSCTVPSLPLASGAAPVGASKAECAGKWNGLHSPVSFKSRLNLSIEVPSPSQVGAQGCRREVSPSSFTAGMRVFFTNNGQERATCRGGFSCSFQWETAERQECFRGDLPLLQVTRHG